MIMNINELYISEIKNSLAQGHAAVLIGSGFSRNSERIDGIDKHMPDWFGLADEFCDKLGIEEKEKKYADPLTLAQEIEEMYGRPFLDNLLREMMSDDQYLPSKLHTDLMRLPWSDVFTTNYDTLLERAYQRITENRYHIVVDQKDLLYSSGQARIIKLHGSFPSNGPFIITEEDFRTYPYDHAPFVNTVQQSLLENTFILIGFSGNDPNFLKWIGWIHDNLGLKNSPKIFMITHNEESAVKVKTLAAKNIETVVLNRIEAYKNDDYKKALGKFLEDLVGYVKKWKNERLLWPDNNVRYDERNGEKLLTELQKTHGAYPGWIVVPFKNHRSVEHILAQVDFFLSFGNEKKNELEICYEYCWYSRMIGRPLFGHMITNILKVLERNVERSSEAMFLEIQLYLLYSYRIQGFENEWNELYVEFKEKGVEEKGEIAISLAYENAMHLIYTLQWQEVEEAVNSIMVDNDHGEWLLRKCSLLALLGRYEEAEQLLEDCISHVRRIILQSKETKVNVRFISLESCLVSLYNHIRQAHRTTKGMWKIENDKSDKERESEQPLKKDYENDFIWQIENERFIGVLSKEYMYIPSEREIPSFDIGMSSFSIKSGEDINLINAYEYIGFREMTGHPFRIGSVTNKEGVLGAVLRLNRYNDTIPLIFSLLTSDNKLLEEAFTRLEIGMIDVDKVDIICSRCISLIRFSMNYYLRKKHINYFDTDLMEYPLRVVPEALSRLCVKCTEEKFDELVDLLIEIYNFADKDMFSNVKVYTQRIIKYMPIAVVHRTLEKFWNIEIMQSEAHLNNNFPDPFQYLWSRLFNKNYKPERMDEKQCRMYEEILEKTKDENYHYPALARATYIFKIYKFTDEQRDKLKNILWDKDNLNEYGLPDLSDFYCTSADEFPHDGEDNDIIERAERYVIDQFEKNIKDESYSSYQHLFNMACHVVEKSEITELKVNKVTNLVLSICKILDKYSNSGISFGRNDAKNDLKRVDELMGLLILRSNLVSAEKSYQNENIRAIIDILDKHEIPHALLSWCVTVDKRNEEIKASAFKGDSSFAHNANQTIYRLTKQGISISEDLKICLVDSIYTTISYYVNSFALGVEYLIDADLLTDTQCQQITTSLCKFDEMTRLVITDTKDSISRKLAMRKVTSILAHTLYKWYERNSITVPEEIIYWKRISESSDEFAEIRLCWE